MALGSALLAGCQPPGFSLVAELADGGVVFRPVERIIWPFGWGLDGVGASQVVIATRERTLWMTMSEDDSPECGKLPELHPFPLRYGQTPTCFRDKVPAKVLPQDVWIRVQTYGFRWSTSFIKIHAGKIESREWREEDAPNEDWQHPDQQTMLPNALQPTDS